METAMIAISLLTVLLLGVLIALLVTLNRSMAAVGAALQETNRAVLPLADDLRVLAASLTETSEGLRAGIGQVSRLTGALGGIGDDLNSGRGALKLGLDVAKMLAGPWLDKLKLLGR